MKKNPGISRRGFLGLGAASVAATALGVTGCAPAESTSDQVASGGDAEQAAGYSFEVAPDPIAEGDIAETMEADVVVVGAGPSGLVTAMSCIDRNLKVIVFSSSEAPVARGGSNAAIFSKKMKELGLAKMEADPFLRTQIADYAFNVDTRKWYKWYNNSEEAMDWLIDTMADTGTTLTIEQGNGYEDQTDPSFAPMASHCWNDEEYTVVADGQPVVVNALAEKIQAAGGQVLYRITAQQLVRGAEPNGTSGRVDAVIGQREDGSYVKFVGTKAVVLATGDFSTDREMMEKYCPNAVELISNWEHESNPDVGKVYGGLYTGQGQKMGLWIGAAWQKTWPNCYMAGVFVTPSAMPYNVHGGLLVDGDGKRFVNEQMGSGNFGQMYRHVKGGQAFAIMDCTYPEHNQPWWKNKMAYGEPSLTPEEVVAGWDEQVEQGSMWKADTLEELVGMIGLPETTLETIQTYNGYCETGVDLEFHKRPGLLTPIATPPFYAAATMEKPVFLTVLGGLRTDENMRVCDEEDAPIEGLYNVGTMVGDAFSGNYNFLIEGHNHGMNCVTFGYMTGRFIAENE